MPAIFQPQIAKRINKTPSVRVIVIFSDHKLLWRDSFKDVDFALTSDESILHKIIIISIIIDASKVSNQFLIFCLEAEIFKIKVLYLHL